MTAPPSALTVIRYWDEELPAGYSYRVDNVPEPASQVQMNGPGEPAAITVTTSSSSQYRITVNADGGAVTID